MSKAKVVITDHGFVDLSEQRRIIEEAGAELVVTQCKTEDEVIAAARGALALLVQWAPVTKSVIAQLDGCRLLVRYGIGVDNVDLAAAREKGITVCNVPDYGIDEVADHAVSLALALGRQLPALDARLRGGVWKLEPVSPLLAYREMTFATAGLGRIARAVLERARGFKFRLAAYDPYVPDSVFEQLGVQKLTPDQLFAQSDVLSLHLPLTPETNHFVNAGRLREMKKTAILVNTARGPLVDTLALAEALGNRTIAYAGLDVFEKEPLPAEHPLRACSNALLSSHVAWYSESSLPLLQVLAAEEVARGLRGQSLKNCVN